MARNLFKRFTPKDISSFRTNRNRPLFTRTTLRNAGWTIAVMVGLYLLFNIFSILILDHQLEIRLDKQIKHEIDHFLSTFYVQHDSVFITHIREFQEPDLITVSESAFYLQIYDKKGRVLVRSQNLQQFSPIPIRLGPQEDEIHFENLMLDGEVLRVGYQKLYNSDHEFFGYLQLATPKAGAKAISKKLILFNVLTFPFTLLLIIAISVFLAKKSYQPINKIIDLANKISATNLSERLAYEADPNDELGRLRDTLNQLFDRLERQIKQISDFTDNASHQLMSPLTVLNTELELILKQSDKNDKQRPVLEVMHEQTQRMIHIVKTLLVMARVQHSCEDQRRVFNIATVINEDIRKLFRDHRITYEIEKNLHVRGNRDYFSLVVQNLIDNAIKYSDSHAPVLVRAYKEHSMVHLEVEDFGVGISDEEKTMIFERFYRGRASDQYEARGFGLGLSLVYSVVTAMGGKIDVLDNHPRGTRFIISLKALDLS